MEIATGPIQADAPALTDASLVYASLVFLVAYTPLQAALWYAPLFVAWHEMSPAKALFFSFVAVMRNKGAFRYYVLTWFAVALVASLLVQAIKMLFGDAPMLMSAMLSPLSLVVLTALYCSFWPTYRDAVIEDAALEDPARRRAAGAVGSARHRLEFGHRQREPLHARAPKLTCARASLPLPSRSTITPSPKRACATDWPTR